MPIYIYWGVGTLTAAWLGVQMPLKAEVLAGNPSPGRQQSQVALSGVSTALTARACS